MLSWQYRWANFLLKTLLMVSILITTSCGNKNTLEKMPLNHEGQIVQDVWIDDRFDFDEYQSIKSAAEEWKYVTRSMVQYRLHYPYYVHNRDFRVRTDRNIMVKTEINDPFVTRADSEIAVANKKKGITEQRVVSGFYYKPIETEENWFIGIVRDRVEDLFRMKIVVMHEFGHAVAVRHQERAVGVMNSSADMSKGCLNRFDIEYFAQIYFKDVGMMNYCSD